MIKIEVTQSSKNMLYAELQNKVSGIKELSNSQTRDDLMTAAYSISSIKFIKQTNLLARSAKKSFHHVYEWNQVGRESGRLFRIIKRQGGSGSASIYYRFNNSKKRSPISADLRVPGKTGKSVGRSGIFKRKAEVMESGSPVSFTTTRNIAFSPRGGGIVFIPPGKTINIMNPGGPATSGSFQSHFISWWKINFPKSLDSQNITTSLENNVARALSVRGAGASAARAAIRSTLAPHLIAGSIT
jgi:hypothetical protein